MIKTDILNAPDMLLMRAVDDPKENVRTAYEMALLADGERLDFREPDREIFSRTGNFIFDYIDALNEISFEIFEDSGLTGGVILGNTANIDVSEASDVFNITFALLEADIFKDHLLNEHSTWLREHEYIV